MAAKCILMVVILKWALSSDIPGIDTKQPRSGDLGCKSHGCVDASNDHGDSDAVDNGPFVQKQELEDTATNFIRKDNGPKILPESDKSRAKSCPAKKKCTNLGGVCVGKGTCTGVVVSKKCTNKCDCCQIKTTPAPLTTSTPWSPSVELMQCCNTTHQMLHRTEQNMILMETNLETNQGIIEIRLQNIDRKIENLTNMLEYVITKLQDFTTIPTFPSTTEPTTTDSTTIPTSPSTTEPTTTAVCDQVCHNGGTCTVPNTCNCTGNWMGKTCEIPCRVMGRQCLHEHTDDALSWSAAVYACVTIGARLLIPDDVNDFSTFAQTYYSDKGFWLGASDVQGFWLWINGDPLIQAGFPWASDPRDNYGYDCLEYHWSDTFWDGKCSVPRNYVCERLALGA